MKTGFFLLPNLNLGGAETVAVQLAESLQQHFDLTLVTYEDGCDFELTVPHLSLGRKLHGRGQRAHRLREWWGGTVDFSVLQRHYNPSFVVSFMELCNISNILVGGASKKFLTVHSHPSSDLAPLYRPLVRATYSQADELWCVSQGIADDLIEAFEIPSDLIHVVPNPIDTSKIMQAAAADVPQDLEFLEGIDYLVHLGRFVPPKNHAFLIELLDRLRQKKPDLRLVLVGDGPLRKNVEELAQHYGFKTWIPGMIYQGEDVIFCGTRKTPFAILNRAKLFVFPSVWEGFGLAIVEAIASGVPICINDCPAGPREIMEFEGELASSERFEYGSLIRVNDMGSWVEEVEFWLSNQPSQKRMAEICGRYDIKAISEQWRLRLDSKS